MSKKSAPRRVGDDQARAFSRSMRVSPRKLNLMAQMIRGKTAEAALAALAFSPRRIAEEVRTVLESAIANAEHNDGADIDTLKIKRIYVEKGTVLKRFTARAKGRGNRILKPTCHIYVTVGD